MDRERATERKGRCYVGIDVGSVSVNSAVIGSHGELLFETPYKRHFGKVEETVHEVIGVIKSRFDDDILIATMMTGNHGQALAENYREELLESFLDFDFDKFQRFDYCEMVCDANDSCESTNQQFLDSIEVA